LDGFVGASIGDKALYFARGLLLLAGGHHAQRQGEKYTQNQIET
jgi:hypothetical protein